MASVVPTSTLRRVTRLPSGSIRASSCQQIRHASLLKRPHRPYTFTQLIALSDGSTYTVRTTSPAAVYRSTQDSRNHPIWQPSLDSLKNVEKDEAGRLRAFRERFGRGWDAEGTVEEEAEATAKSVDAPSAEQNTRAAPAKAQEDQDSLFDLISGAAKGKN